MGLARKSRWLFRGREQRRLHSLKRAVALCAHVGQRALDGDIRQHALALNALALDGGEANLAVGQLPAAGQRGVPEIGEQATWEVSPTTMARPVLCSAPAVASDALALSLSISTATFPA